MKTRVGKIARLSYDTREKLNLRLLNGEFGAPLIAWLNELPDTKEVVNDYFGGKPITKQNLSEWRHGGYEDWLRQWHRQDRFQQMTEQGEELEQDEGADMFENFSRIVLAEMVEDLNSLHEITNRNERWKRLREISRDLARLQHSYNHSRKVLLSFAKWNSDASDDEPETPGKKNLKRVPEIDAPPIVARASCPCESHGRAARATTEEPSPVAPSPCESMQKNSSADDSPRHIYHRECYRGCVCKDCHPSDGKYPYDQALKDDTAQKDPAYWKLKKDRHPMITHLSCDCYCPECVVWEKTRPFLAANPPATTLPTAETFSEVGRPVK